MQAMGLGGLYYDTHFDAGASLETHAEHMRRWHPDETD
jgi:hypothetical protein